LELLAVMAAVGLFTVGSIKGYDMFKAKTKAQNTAKMISTMAVERQSPLYKGKKNSDTTYNVKGPHSQLYLKEGKAGNLGKFFWIETEVSSSAFCTELKESELIHPVLTMVNGEVDGNCTGTLFTLCKDQHHQ